MQELVRTSGNVASGVVVLLLPVCDPTVVAAPSIGGNPFSLKT